MTTQTEALKLADRLLDFASEVSADFDTTTLEKAADELRRLDSALAKQSNEQVEPVAWMRMDVHITDTHWGKYGPNQVFTDDIPLYTVPQQRKEPEQRSANEHLEPVAWRFTGIAGLKRYMTQKQYDAQTPETKKWYEPYKCVNCTTPPQQKPLTDEQLTSLRDAFAQALSRDVYVCERACGAWDYGTMEEGDFQPADECEEVLDSLIDAVCEEVLKAVPPEKAKEKKKHELCPSCRNSDIYACTCTSTREQPKPEPAFYSHDGYLMTPERAKFLGFPLDSILALYTTQPQPKAPPEQWRERWYGSLAQKGWWICCGREHIAHLGTEVSSDEVRKIVDAHNRYKLPAQPKETEPVSEEREFWLSVVERLDKNPASPTQGMTLRQRISHVGGQENAAGYIEFGSVMAVKALISHVLRDTQQRKPLTDEQIATIWYGFHDREFGYAIRFARAIEAAHGIKE